MFKLPASELLISKKEGINIKYLPQRQLSAALSVLKEQNLTPLLLIDHFQNPTFSSTPSTALIHLNSGLHSVGEKQCELWIGSGDWQQGKTNLYADIELSFCFNQDFLIGSLSLPLSSGASLQDLSQIYYEQIMHYISDKNQHHLLRMWNYLPFINQIDNDLERYQQFCIGRHEGFAINKMIDFAYPAASAVGNYSNGDSAQLVITFIATQHCGHFLENPNQISAYQYPDYYSPRSPSFARASIYQTEKLEQLYISGTASIVGHESKFSGDIINQTHQTIKNLKYLIDHSNEAGTVSEVFHLSSTDKFAPAVKVYLRNPADLDKVQAIIQAFIPGVNNVCYLQADICRQELDIEIEMLLNRPGA